MYSVTTLEKYSLTISLLSSKIRIISFTLDISVVFMASYHMLS